MIANLYKSWEDLKVRAEQSAPASFVILGSNSKVVKGEKEAYLTACIHLSPSTESGINMCAKSGACADVCLNGSGLHKMPQAKSKRIALTHWFIKDPKSFFARLEIEIEAFARKAYKKNMVPALRPNGLSDRRDLAMFCAKVGAGLGVRTYDYTKLPIRKTPGELSNHLPGYHLTFSRDETNWSECLKALALGYNVSVVFAGPIPPTYEGYEVINGDVDDLRFIQRTDKPCIIGLSFKGGSAQCAKAVASGFAVVI